MEYKPLISVVMPNFNGERFVALAIDSVIDQTYNNWELIVVDDKSTDRSPDIVEEYCRQDRRIRIIRAEENHGVAVTRNTGIQSAAGKYIALLDNDDLWEPDKLERQLKLAEAGADIVYCSYDFCDEDNNQIKKPFIVPGKTDYKNMLASCVISCSSCFAKTELLKSHPFKTEYYHEDYVLWMELLSIPVKAVGDCKVLMHYRQVIGSRSNRKGNAAKERWNIYRSALGLNLFESMLAFTRYAIRGVMKYYF